MKTRIYERSDASAGLQQASTWLQRKPNELEDGRNIRFNELIGGIVRRLGYVKAGEQFSTAEKKPTGFHTAQFTTGTKRFVAVDNAAGTNTLIRVQEPGGAWTTLITDIPAGADVYFKDFRDEVYISGVTVADNRPFQPRNVDKDLDVSITRNLLFAPWPKYFEVFRGVLYAANVRLNTERYSDRFYKASAPTGAITFIRGAQANTRIPVTYINQVPVMTSFNSPTGIAFASTEVNSDNFVFQAFDKDYGRRWIANGATNQFAGYDFGVGNTKVITHYSVSCSTGDAGLGRDPRSWSLQGSNNNSAWTDLHTISNAARFSTTSNDERTFETTNTTAYRYYRVFVYANWGGDYISLNEVRLLTTVQASRPYLLNIDSVRYIKKGMELDIYRSGKADKVYDITVSDVDNAANTIQFLPEAFNISNVNATTNVITVSSTDKFPTGTPILFTSSSTLPAPLNNTTTYYAIRDSATQLRVATSLDNATIGQAIDITNTGSPAGAVHSVMISYVFNNNDEIYLDGRFGKLTTFWNTDYPTPDKADWSAVQPGSDSSNEITAIRENTGRLFVATLNSMSRFDGNNTTILSRTIGCASQRSMQSIDDDWLIWLTARGKVYARSESSGQQEYISRGLWNKFFAELTLDQFKSASAGITDGEYSLYVGEFNGRPHRAVYDFGSNTWTIDELSHPTLFYGNDSTGGTIKPFFVSDNGYLYQDDTGNQDDDKNIRFFVDYGPINYGTEADKELLGAYIYSQNAIGTKIAVGVDGGQQITAGEIKDSKGQIKYPIAQNRDKFKGSAVRVTLQSSINGPPQQITAVHDFFNVVEEVTGSGYEQK